MTPTITEPIEFEPIYQERIWGGRELERRFGRQLPSNQPFGESWELSDRPEAQSRVARGPLQGISLGELWRQHRRAIFGIDPDAADAEQRFPLLIKILDARDDLSLQVHPPESVAASLGGEPKTEMWFIAHAEPGARLYAGLRPGVTRQDFEKALRDGTAERLVHVIEPRTSDVLFIPSGRLHAIGKGLLIYEIQQNSDTTYRVYDWNRLGLNGKPRQLHIGQALRSIDFEDFTPEMAIADGETLVQCSEFEVSRWQLAAGEDRGMVPGRFAICAVIEGPIHCRGRSYGEGQFFLIPAANATDFRLEAGEASGSVLHITC